MQGDLRPGGTIMLFAHAIEIGRHLHFGFGAASTLDLLCHSSMTLRLLNRILNLKLQFALMPASM